MKFSRSTYGEWTCRRCSITLDSKPTPERLCLRCLGSKPRYCPDYYTCDRHVVSECRECMRLIHPKPKRDVIKSNPEEEPGYGHGI